MINLGCETNEYIKKKQRNVNAVAFYKRG